MRERRCHCAICHRVTRHGWVFDAWRCLNCGARADGSDEEGMVWVVLSSPSAEDVEDVWVEGVFSKADKAVAYMRAQSAADYFWAEWHRVDKPN